ncbi:MAG: lipopolysaccharide heptosyltransferase II [Phycisphaeraceae bacterium]|nr:lipopolysaccharide heptosyltransferase II [Phycisphaeraceae bacterium]
MPGSEQPKPHRLLVVCPSWLGDCVMATPALRRLRSNLPGCFIGGLLRPGMDEVLAGLPCFDEVHVARSSGVMGPKFVAAKIRPRRYDAAVLLTNSFSTALIVRIAGIPRRIGYDRDARGLLLTDRLTPPTRSDGRRSPVSAVTYYQSLAARTLGVPDAALSQSENKLSLCVTAADAARAREIFDRADISPDTPRVILNPGGNNAAKRWPIDRFAALAKHLHESRGLAIFLNGSPGEADLVDEIAGRSGVPCVCLPHLGIIIGSLKALIQGSALMVTNDTGPRHIAAAFSVPLVSLFGPTDPRWTTIVAPAGETILTADPSLPESEVADDHPDRCSIDRISLESVLAAADQALSSKTASFRPESLPS